jgi:integrase/recombinase XerD
MGITDLKQSTIKNQQSKMTIEEYLRGNYSPATFHSNMYCIRRFTDYYPCGKAEGATYSDVLAYIEYLRKNFDLHPKTLRNSLHAVKIYFNWLVETGRRKDHPCSEIRLKDRISKQIHVDSLYSEQALECFFDTVCASRRKRRLDNRNKIIVSLLVYQALTVTEIAELTIGDIDLEKGEIRIKAGYHQRARTLPLKARQVLMFYNYLHGDRPELLAFAKEPEVAGKYFILGQYGEKINPHGISKMINGYRAAGEKIQPEKIRQSVIANLLKNENDTRIVQVFAGHRRVSTTVQYRGNELETLQAAVGEYHPVK